MRRMDISIHESSHAVASFAAGFEVVELSIRPQYNVSAGHSSYKGSGIGVPAALISLAGQEGKSSTGALVGVLIVRTLTLRFVSQQ